MLLIVLVHRRHLSSLLLVCLAHNHSTGTYSSSALVNTLPSSSSATTTTSTSYACTHARDWKQSIVSHLSRSYKLLGVVINLISLDTMAALYSVLMNWQFMYRHMCVSAAAAALRCPAARSSTRAGGDLRNDVCSHSWNIKYKKREISGPIVRRFTLTLLERCEPNIVAHRRWLNFVPYFVRQCPLGCNLYLFSTLCRLTHMNERVPSGV